MNETYQSPLSTRYASTEMKYLFSAQNKFKTWRRLWIALAKSEQKLGLNITVEQIEELEKYKNDINYEVAAEQEKKVRHDVMAHVYAYAQQATQAAPIIHLGATSCYIGDNTDIIIMRDGLRIIKEKLFRVISNLAEFASKHKSLPCLAYTHLQPAQLTTVGKRAVLWIYELMMDLEDLESRLASLKMLGSKGTTGTQASFLELFEGNIEKIYMLEKLIADEMGFDNVVEVSGQTYSRKVDAAILSLMSQIAQSASKFANDMRILQSFKEMEEPFEDKQIGSSAMPYKRNPMRCERICALARYVIINSINPAITASVQWFERTLDDSANKRIAVAEAFLAIDAILNIYINVTDGIVVYPKVIAKRIKDELPFMASENIMMSAVKKGKDRQKLHEKIRTYAMQAGKKVKEQGAENDLIARICADLDFDLRLDEIQKIIDPENFTGISELQVERYLAETVYPMLKFNKIYNSKVELTV